MGVALDQAAVSRNQWGEQNSTGGTGSKGRFHRGQMELGDVYRGQVRRQWRPMGVCGVGRWGLGSTNVIASTATTMPIGRLQRQDLEGSEWGGAGLGGNHASETSHRPCPHVVVVSTD